MQLYDFFIKSFVKYYLDVDLLGSRHVAVKITKICVHGF